MNAILESFGIAWKLQEDKTEVTRHAFAALSIAVKMHWKFNLGKIRRSSELNSPSEVCCLLLIFNPHRPQHAGRCSNLTIEALPFFFLFPLLTFFLSITSQAPQYLTHSLTLRESFAPLSGSKCFPPNNASSLAYFSDYVSNLLSES